MTEKAVFGAGCFWEVEAEFRKVKGVVSTAVGYSGGFTPNPTYEEVCSGRTGHAEVVLVAYDPSLVRYDDLLTVFWERHDPTQGMRPGPLFCLPSFFSPARKISLAPGSIPAQGSSRKIR